MKKEIRIVKDRATDYTFLDDGLHASRSAAAEAGGKKKERRVDPRIAPGMKKFKPKLAGGHGKQGHSPIYE